MLHFHDLFEETKRREFVDPWWSFNNRFPPDTVSVRIRREKDVHGFHPTLMMMTGIGRPPEALVERPYDEDWDDRLILRGVRAEDPENESVRFSLFLQRRFRKVGAAFGAGLFNSTIVGVLRESEGDKEPKVAEVLEDVSVNEPPVGEDDYERCRKAVLAELSDAAGLLMECLKYGKEEAEEILSGAVAKFLDERFSVTDRRNLGRAGKP